MRSRASTSSSNEEVFIQTQSVCQPIRRIVEILSLPCAPSSHPLLDLPSHLICNACFHLDHRYSLPQRPSILKAVIWSTSHLAALAHWIVLSEVQATMQMQ